MVGFEAARAWHLCGERRWLTLVFAMTAALLLGACRGNDESPIVDSDRSNDEVIESSLPGTSVGLWMSVAKYAGKPVVYSLIDDADGTFAIHPLTGIVTLVGSVDYEAAQRETIVVRAEVSLERGTLRFDRRFDIQVLDSPPPTLDISFPFAHARYDAPRLAVSGRIRHPQLESVLITAEAGGELIAIRPTGEQFSITEIDAGEDSEIVLTVSATHPGGDTTTHTLRLSREPELTDVPRIVLDAARDQILMVDAYSASIIASPLSGASRTTVSGRYKGAGPLFSLPNALALDAHSDTLYVADEEADVLFAVELENGNRRIVSSRSQGSGPMFFTPKELDIDTARGRVIMSDEGQGLFVIDPVSGNRSVFSSQGATSPSIYAYRGIGVDAVRDRYLVSDGGSVFSIHPDTGASSVVSPFDYYGKGSMLTGMSVASASGLLYMGEELADGAVRIDLTTGARELLTSSGLPPPWDFPVIGDGSPLQYPSDVAIDERDNRLVLIEGEYADPLLQILPNGNRALIRDGSLGSGLHFRGPSGIHYDATRGTLATADWVADIVVEVDPVTGDRTFITGDATGHGSIENDLIDVEFNPVTGLFYVVDAQNSVLFSVDPTTGARSEVTGSSVSSTVPFTRPVRIELDVGRNVAYVLDWAGSIAVVDLANGARRQLPLATMSPVDIALDSENQRIFTIDGYGGSISRFDLATETQRDIATGSGFGYRVRSGIAYDSANDRLLLLEEYPVPGVFAVDISTGTVTLISRSHALSNSLSIGGAVTTPGAIRETFGPELKWPEAISVDVQRQIAFVTDDAYDGVIAVDLVSGYRQLISK